MNHIICESKVFVIAEIGVNHNGDLGLAKQLIDSAKLCGADAVKFQTFKARNLALLDTPKVRYQEASTPKNETHYEMLHRLELSEESHIELASYCKFKQIEFMSTPYDVESAKFLDAIGIKYFKTASADIVDLPLQKYIASTGKPSLVATGMATLGEVERVVQIYDEANNPNLVLLHCVSNYPCSDGSLNLRAMSTLSRAFRKPVGFSDHSIGNLAAIVAVSRGAKVVEKHFTLDREMDGPDHKASSTPGEFCELVANVRRVENMLGGWRKICQAEERQMASVSRKSICLARDVDSQAVLQLDDIVLKRPGTGIEPSFIDDIVGKVAKHSLAAGVQLKWSDLEDLS